MSNSTKQVNESLKINETKKAFSSPIIVQVKNQTNGTNVTTLSQQKFDPLISINIGSNGTTSVTIGDKSNSSNGAISSKSSESATAKVDAVAGTVAVSGNATGTANISAPAIVKDAKEVVKEAKEVAKEGKEAIVKAVDGAGKAADTVEKAANKASDVAESVSKRVAGFSGFSVAQNASNTTALPVVIKSDVNITIGNNGEASVSIGGAKVGSNGIGSTNSSGSATAKVDPLAGTAGVSGTASGGANASAPAVAKEAAAKAVEGAGKAAAVAGEVAKQASTTAEDVGKKIGGAVSGFGFQ